MPYAQYHAYTNLSYIYIVPFHVPYCLDQICIDMPSYYEIFYGTKISGYPLCFDVAVIDYHLPFY